MSKELSEETKYELKLFGREINRDLTNLMELLRKQDKDNKAILYAGRHIQKIILPVEEYQKMCQRLEAINNANPSEALECLETIKGEQQRYSLPYDEEIKIIKQALIKAQEQDFNYKNIVIPFFDELTNVLGTNDIDEMLDKIKEQEKVLEIIKKKNVMVYALKVSKTVDDYNDLVSTDEQLTQEEFDLLKR